MVFSSRHSTPARLPMRAQLPILVALALLAPAAPALAGDPARELIVQLSANAVASLTCRFGIAVLGSIAMGSRIQRTMFSGVFASSPAMMPRVATPESGGPILPCAPVTPRIS